MSERVREYEQKFGKRAEAPFAVSFAYARTALAAILKAAGLKPGDEVLLSPLTCKVVPLAILGAGFKPVYGDIRADTLNLDAEKADKAIGSSTRAMLFQRTYGNAAGVSEACGVARAHGLLFVEDAAQCMPDASAWAGDAAIFSNNPGKPLPAGSGGMAVVRNAELAERVREYRDALPAPSRRTTLRTRAEAWVRNTMLTPGLYWPAFNISRKFDEAYRVRPLETEIASEFQAVSTRIDDAQADAGLKWLVRADAVSNHRAKACAEYARLLQGNANIGMPVTDARPLYWFPVLVPGKESLLREASRRRIEMVPWPLRAPIYPLSDTGRLVQYGYTDGSCPIAEDVAGRLVGLPTHPLVGETHIQQAVDLLSGHSARRL